MGGWWKEIGGRNLYGEWWEWWVGELNRVGKGQLGASGLEKGRFCWVGRYSGLI